jgi:hypothetical protein
MPRIQGHYHPIRRTERKHDKLDAIKTKITSKSLSITLYPIETLLAIKILMLINNMSSQ